MLRVNCASSWFFFTQVNLAVRKRVYSCNIQQCSVRQIVLRPNFIQISCYVSHILYRVFLQHTSIFAMLLSWRVR